MSAFVDLDTSSGFWWEGDLLAEYAILQTSISSEKKTHACRTDNLKPLKTQKYNYTSPMTIKLKMLST